MKIGDKVFCPRSDGSFTKAEIAKIEGITALCEWSEQGPFSAVVIQADGTVRFKEAPTPMWKWVALSKLRPVPRPSDPYLELVSMGKLP